MSAIKASAADIQRRLEQRLNQVREHDIFTIPSGLPEDIMDEWDLYEHDDATGLYLHPEAGTGVDHPEFLFLRILDTNRIVTLSYTDQIRGLLDEEAKSYHWGLFDASINDVTRPNFVLPEVRPYATMRFAPLKD